MLFNKKTDKQKTNGGQNITPRTCRGDNNYKKLLKAISHRARGCPSHTERQ